MTAPKGLIVTLLPVPGNNIPDGLLAVARIYYNSPKRGLRIVELALKPKFKDVREFVRTVHAGLACIDSVAITYSKADHRSALIELLSTQITLSP